MANKRREIPGIPFDRSPIPTVALETSLNDPLYDPMLLKRTLRTERVMGWTLAASWRRGNWCTYLCSILPSLGTRTSSPSSYAFYDSIDI